MNITTYDYQFQSV